MTLCLAVNKEKRKTSHCVRVWSCAFTGRMRLSTRVTPLDLARVWFADEKMFRLSVRPSPQNQRVWLRSSESKTAHLRSESSATSRVQSSQAESLQGVMVALTVNLVHGFSPIHTVREHCKVSCATISCRSVSKTRRASCGSTTTRRVMLHNPQ